MLGARKDEVDPFPPVREPPVLDDPEPECFIELYGAPQVPHSNARIDEAHLSRHSPGGQTQFIHLDRRAGRERRDVFQGKGPLSPVFSRYIFQCPVSRPRRAGPGVALTTNLDGESIGGVRGKRSAGRSGLRLPSTSTQTRLQELRRTSDESTTDRLFLATLRVRVPGKLWTGPFSSLHPTVRLEILNRIESGPGVSVSDYWISGSPPGVWAREIATYPDVVAVDSLAEVADGCLYRVTYRNPPVVALYRKLHLPIQFPLRLQGGYIRWEVVARRSEFELIMKHMRATDPNFSIVSIRRRPLRSHLPMLSDAQKLLLDQAMAAGYFAVPRGITLTALARKLDRSKSGVSEAIALIEKKLFESVLQPNMALT